MVCAKLNASAGTGTTQAVLSSAQEAKQAGWHWLNRLLMVMIRA
ncbi:hypothetical protein IMCC3088_179 [Aequoribacter fuscus]|uniref:Uncharacterized protein n=1 Tax=Aequoribacter fuscus TaxID=2518989 RepID=F3KZ68_9GAMM|nr:hypothetical protein IMCC3088_179 [Aequoribacter fuscus]